MPYTPQTWNDGSAGGTPISAARLTVMETGIDTAHDTADTAASDATTALANAATAQGDATQALSDAAAAQSTADAAVAEALVDVKGDLVVATAADTVARLAVGTDGRFLEADSVQATGIKWGRKITVSASAPSSPTTGDLWLKPKV